MDRENVTLKTAVYQIQALNGAHLGRIVAGPYNGNGSWGHDLVQRILHLPSTSENLIISMI
jgi:hypothetical protein